ncbi:sigma-70 family RNA polymerase sigma factor [Sphingobacterium phlebotomi]|uniref:Sigma-70 family RNA polymerase sigma factor n=1 Tax=Sphingobacterium phlebotomi TaxID=2605433 RepID=A0A5D4GSG4_9SPHI|nr:sigma-70 family RNA polymerase sigma factor [Sphingobacterium phlebotomi]TYR31781.1 sigma-70 family RNA polymerase sigma factor [Sphingobacterium phlebotomi]
MKDRPHTDLSSTPDKMHIPFEQVYYAYYRSLFFYTKQMIEDEADVHDLLSDTFLKYYDRQDQFTDIEQAKAFLFTTIRHAALNHIRHHKVRQDKGADIASSIYETSSKDHFFDKLVLTELMGLVTEEIEKLPAKQQAVFKLAYFEDRTTEEIAELLQIKHEAVYNNKKRALEKLQKIFKNKEFPIYLAFLKFFMG